MIDIKVKCMFCGHSLMDNKHKIDSRPSIRVAIACNNQKCDLYLSSLYGSFKSVTKSRTNAGILDGKIAYYYCPHCRRELKDARKCGKCNAPMIPLEREEGGIVLVCARMSCKKPIMEFESLEAEIKAFYENYNTF